MNGATYASKSTEQSGIAYEARHATREDCRHDDWRVVAYTDFERGRGNWSRPDLTLRCAAELRQTAWSTSFI